MIHWIHRERGSVDPERVRENQLDSLALERKEGKAPLAKTERERERERERETLRLPGFKERAVRLVQRE